MHKFPSCGVRLSVSPFVCLPRSCFLSKFVNISSKFLHHWVHTIHSKRYGIHNIPTGTPYSGASNACSWGREKSQFVLSMVWVPPSVIHSCAGPWKVGGTLRGRVCWLREMDDELFMTISLRVTPKTTEQNLIIRSGKSEATITNNKRQRLPWGTVLLKLTTDRHEASRGLSATVELLGLRVVSCRS